MKLATGLGCCLLRRSPRWRWPAPPTPSQRAGVHAAKDKLGRAGPAGVLEQFLDHRHAARSPDYPNLVHDRAEVAKMEGEDYYNNRTREDAKPNRPRRREAARRHRPSVGRRLQRLLGRSRASHVALREGRAAVVVDRGAGQRPHSAQGRSGAAPRVQRLQRRARPALPRRREPCRGRARLIAMRAAASAAMTIPRRARWASAASSASATPAGR